MNIINKHNKIYKYESVWRDKIDDNKTDSNNVSFPFPTMNNEWSNQIMFLHKLEAVQDYLLFVKKYDETTTKDCLICHEKNITHGMFKITNIFWEDGLVHYIEKHNIKPSDEFIEMIFSFMMPQKNNLIRVTGKKIKKK